jgi:hypothetical protein
MSDTYVKQYGGTHYESDYPHWDWVADIGMGYFPGNATKYVSRWRKKNGLADLKKAMTYIDKMIAIRSVNRNAKFNDPIGNGYKIGVCTERFVAGLENLELSICEALSFQCDDVMLRVAKKHLQTLITNAQRAQEAGLPLVAPTPTTTPGMGPAAAKTGGPGRAGRATTQAPASSASTEVASMPSVVDSDNPEAHDYLAGMENRGKIDHPSPFGYEEDDG